MSGFLSGLIDVAGQGASWLGDKANTGMNAVGQGYDSAKDRVTDMASGDFSGAVDDYDLAALADEEDSHGGAVMAHLGTGREALASTAVKTEADEMRSRGALEESKVDWTGIGNAASGALKKLQDRKEGRVSSSSFRPGFKKVQDTSLQAKMIEQEQAKQFADTNMLQGVGQQPQSIQALFSKM